MISKSISSIAAVCWLLVSVCDGFASTTACPRVKPEQQRLSRSLLEVATSPVNEKVQGVASGYPFGRSLPKQVAVSSKGPIQGETSAASEANTTIPVSSAESKEEEKDDAWKDVTATLSLQEIKTKLLNLLPSMTGKEEEFRLVEAYVNALEDRYMPAQTLGFLNLAMQGDWQLLFSTNLSLTSIRKFRLRELYQRVETTNFEGTVTNNAVWDLADGEDDTVFDAWGTFSVKCPYKINQGARMVLNVENNTLRPARGSKIPADVQDLVGRLHRAMPRELFDPSDHAMDTTYVDTDLRIVRMTGPRFEGVRNIFIRRGALEINPTN